MIEQFSILVMFLLTVLLSSTIWSVNGASASSTSRVLRATATTTSQSSDLNPAVYIPIVVIAVLLVILLLICFCFYKRTKKRLPEEYSTVPENSSSIDQTKSEQRERTKHGSDKPVGIMNSDNECYMNSSIQALASLPKFIKQLNEMPDNIASIMFLRKLINDINHIDINKKVSPKENKKNLKYLIDTIKWNKKAQQDSFEFISHLAEHIQEDLKNNNINVEILLRNEIFHKITGSENGNKIQSHMGLSLGLCGAYQTKPGVKLKELIEKFFEPSPINDDPNRMLRMYFNEDYPEILILHIQANKFNRSTSQLIKPTYYIQYSENLDLNIKVQKVVSKKINVQYELKSVICHNGSRSSGHYTTFRKFQNQWFLMDDSHVSRVKFKCDRCPYILFYEKKTD